MPSSILVSFRAKNVVPLLVCVRFRPFALELQKLEATRVPPFVRPFDSPAHSRYARRSYYAVFRWRGRINADSESNVRMDAIESLTQAVVHKSLVQISHVFPQIRQVRL
jgi:hypothetical protein